MEHYHGKLFLNYPCNECFIRKHIQTIYNAFMFIFEHNTPSHILEATSIVIINVVIKTKFLLFIETNDI
jgi:hypothetical protein